MSVVHLGLEPRRSARWIDNFAARHGGLVEAGVESLVSGKQYRAADGSWFEFRASFPGIPPTPVVDPPPAPEDWAVLIVRKGGFAVARLSGATVQSSKVGRRHVQGRTKAGGQSQQRFARRRDNQARDAYRAAADHAATHTAGLKGPVVTAGDESGLREVLLDPRLAKLTRLHRVGDVAEPRRDTLEAMVADVLGWQVQVFNAP